MKLRIRGNSLRLRLTKTEIAELAAAGYIENHTRLGLQPNCFFVYRLKLSGNVKEAKASCRGNEICVELPQAEAMAWAQGEAVGIYAEESWGLKIAVEKDFKCLDPRLDEDESDAFENPHGTSHSVCPSTSDD